MKEESNIKPEKNFKIENITDEGKCDVIFYEDIIEEIRDAGEKETKVYSYNFYRITVRYRETLEEDLENNYKMWLEFAKKNTQEN